ncbi:MAG: PAS domain-containing protein [Synergistaceae bacterium]|nr:PAS domain-containing protein [Synergistaceae bacterium]
MGVSRDVFSLINASPEAILIVDRKRGKFSGANTAFSELMGFANDDFLGTQMFDLPFRSRDTMRRLFRLFFMISQGAGRVGTYTFNETRPDGTVVKVSASARVAGLGDKEYVIFNFRQEQPAETPPWDADSWESYLKLAYGPYMEFRPAAPIHVIDDPESRVDFLRMLGDNLRVKFFNRAANRFYYEDQGTLEGRTFLSLFDKESDAIGFLDMLSVVGRMKAEAAVSTNKAIGVQMEMDCTIKFDENGDVAALYCGQRDLSEAQRYRNIIGGSKFELEFMLQQPFVGFAFLIPNQPLECPSNEDIDSKLDEMLDQITVIRGNDAMVNIYNLDKSKFFMKPMRELFYDAVVARKVLKELFVARESSSGRYNAAGGEDGFERVSIYRGTFDKAGRLTGVFVATSRHSYGFHPHYSSIAPLSPQPVNSGDSA